MRAASISRTEPLRFLPLCIQGCRVIAVVLDGVWFVDLWGPILIEFFNR